MKVPPKLINLPSDSHLIKDIISIPRPPLHAQIISSQDLVVVHMPRSLEVIDDPFVEMVAPVRKRVSECCARFALSVERIVRKE
jgi:hypothetical protein